MNEVSNTPPVGGGRAPARGTTILVLGILSLVICGLIGPFAWIMGKGDLEKMDRGLMDRTERGITKAGMVCGIVATGLLLVSVVVFLFVVVAQASLISAGGL